MGRLGGSSGECVRRYNRLLVPIQDVRKVYCFVWRMRYTYNFDQLATQLGTATTRCIQAGRFYVALGPTGEVAKSILPLSLFSCPSLGVTILYDIYTQYISIYSLPIPTILRIIDGHPTME